MKLELKGKAKLLIFIALITLALIDLGFVTFGDDTSGSISAAMSYVGIRRPFIAVVLGMCLGHFFPMELTGKCPKCGELIKEEK